MKMMLQLVSPTAGKIMMFGKDHREQMKDTYQKIGSIIETPGFYTNLTGQENLEILARFRKNVSKASVKHALEVVGLDQEKKKPFSDYSLGMKQRLGIAAAIMHEPELLILDEPINGLDPIGISEIRQFLCELSRTKGTTIFISSHILSEIEQIVSGDINKAKERLAFEVTKEIHGVINQGKLVEEVNMKELHKRKRKYVAFTVSDALSAAKILENQCNVRDYDIQDHMIKIFETEFNVGYFNQILVENQLVVTGINTCEDNLENYFSELIGGGGIA